MRFAVFVCIAALLFVLIFAGLNRELILQYERVDLGFAQYKVLLFPVTILCAAAVLLLVLLAVQVQIAVLRRRIRRLEEHPPRADFTADPSRSDR
ncbi:MAG TPA: hypothetical protein VGB99_15975 [Acidobacteriota bacterium]